MATVSSYPVDMIELGEVSICGLKPYQKRASLD